MKRNVKNILLSVFDVNHDARIITNWLESTASVSKKYNQYANWEFIALFMNFAFLPEIISIGLIITNHKNIIFMTVSVMLLFIFMDLFMSIGKFTKIDTNKSIASINIVSGLKSYLSIFFLASDIVSIFLNKYSSNNIYSVACDIFVALLMLIVTFCSYPSTKELFNINKSLSFKKPRGLKLFFIYILEVNFTIFCTWIIITLVGFGICIGSWLLTISISY